MASDSLRIPGIPNLHSHAFQRAMAGMAERQTNPEDSFWTWRETMYRMAARFDPDSLHAVASQLYVEMLETGYTSVCEFHYLHHQADGQPYDDRSAMAQAIIAEFCQLINFPYQQQQGLDADGVAGGTTIATLTMKIVIDRATHKLTLFRPKLKPTHVFGPGRQINVERRFLSHDNGWGAFADDVVGLGVAAVTVPRPRGHAVRAQDGDLAHAFTDTPAERVDDAERTDDDRDERQRVEQACPAVLPFGEQLIARYHDAGTAA